MSEARLERIALHHLDRYDATVAHLRRLLRRRVERSLREHGGESGPWDEAIDTLLQRLVDAGLLDDRRFARVRCDALRRRGASIRHIRADLRERGVPGPILEACLRSQHEEEHEVPPERVAAIRLARRRRFGPWRDPARRAERRDKDLAAMARAGFAFGLARDIVDAEDAEALEDILRDAE